VDLAFKEHVQNFSGPKLIRAKFWEVLKIIWQLILKGIRDKGLVKMAVSPRQGLGKETPGRIMTGKLIWFSKVRLDHIDT
jgi:hypothetical protein